MNFNKVLKSIFGDKSSRDMKLIQPMVEKAKSAGFKKIIGEYLPTPKNKMVEEHYPGLGFSKIEGSATAQYELDVEAYQPRECYISKKEV